MAADDDELVPRDDLERLADGGIPAAAEARLRALAVPGAAFTSGLSVKEFALLDRMGPEPIAQVMGASVVRPGYQYLPALPPGPQMLTYVFTPSGSVGGFAPAPMGRNASPYTEATPRQVRDYHLHEEVVCTLEDLGGAWNLARRRALDRLAEEALQVNADAVVGVTVTRSDYDLGARTIEFVVTGTAVRFPGSDGTNGPLLTDVSVQDLWRLGGLGQEAVGLLATTAVTFASPPRTRRYARARTTMVNQELGELSEAFALARTTAREALRSQLKDARGQGAVGVRFRHSVRRETLSVASSIQSQTLRGWRRGALGLPYFNSGKGVTERRGWVITMHAEGTAIRPVMAGSGDEIKAALRLGGR